MAPVQFPRRRFMQAIAGTSVLALLGCKQEQTMVTLYTFGDSILDCGRYNESGVHPGQLLVQNDDRLFPEFQGQDLASRGPARLDHRARDGATVEGLQLQVQGLQVQEPAIALITIGGNDLLGGLIGDRGVGMTTFANALDRFVQHLPIRPVLLGNVYDPTLGDDNRNFLGIEAKVARKNLERMNRAVADIAHRYGQLIDLHAHFLSGDLSWFTATIEPSLKGASEVRRAFLPYVLQIR
ncbi:SGNH/GDSL hydrolase family protein [Leptolyngbya sp. FACHB-17]|uniref:SGNH/GDSL hydrolase family protein n=1 Tax=unclassified Leptolyngbya TaxID=2650499 RepID=UPI001681109A|nr:SGNH/GDSL hydrolase family protein [Leptolyngbya sp. FACHB-17]MBD2081582.1 SGNH/GDSL hydrolase family protein [Leptolyngbya sp. FACHB-17]